ncbi:hypothetical protein DFH27DRAFT_641741 [Peziza echinospora]|nr:hypothetical protein DFH27DRAFT_641741 [Peziza echinospora]
MSTTISALSGSTKSCATLLQLESKSGHCSAHRFPSEDDNWFRSRLNDDSSRLFGSDVLNVQVFSKSFQGEDLDSYSQTFCHPAGLEAFLNDSQKTWNETIVFVPSYIPTYHVFLPFLDFIHAFGQRQRAGDEHFNTYHLRYPTDRDVKYAIYQQNGPTTTAEESNASRWIIVQPSDTFKSRTLQYIDASNEPGIQVKKKGDYINSLEQELTVLEEAAVFSSFEERLANDYVVKFQDSQALQRLTKKLLKAKNILLATSTIIEGYRKHAVRSNSVLSDGDLEVNLPAVELELELLQGRFKNHEASINSLIELAAGVSTLLSQILEHRNEDSLLFSSKQIHATSESSHRTNELISQNSMALRKLSTDSQADTQAMKTLTIIALLYLPASLIASVFSSNLVKTSEGNGPEHFVLARQFWVYPVLSAALLIFTVLPIIIWNRISSARPHKPSLNTVP